MRIQMLDSKKAAPDGITVLMLEEGESYDVPDSFGERYVDEGLAVEVEPVEEDPEHPDQDDAGDPGDEHEEKEDDDGDGEPSEEGKLDDAAPENKGGRFGRGGKN
jgi:hypothetical protein